MSNPDAPVIPEWLANVPRFEAEWHSGDREPGTLIRDCVRLGDVVAAAQQREAEFLAHAEKVEADRDAAEAERDRLRAETISLHDYRTLAQGGWKQRELEGTLEVYKAALEKCADAYAEVEGRRGLPNTSNQAGPEAGEPPVLMPPSTLPDPCCHGCGGPVALGEPVVVYHSTCERNRQPDLTAPARSGRPITKSPTARHLRSVIRRDGKATPRAGCSPTSRVGGGI